MKVVLGQARFGPESGQPNNDAESTLVLPDDLESDFQKEGTPASWAEKYPKEWGSEYWRFSTDNPNQAVSSSSSTSDEKFLAVSTQNTICIFAVEGFKLVTVLKTEYDFVHQVEFAKGSEEEGYTLVVYSQKDLSGREGKVKVWILNGEGDEADQKWEAEGKFPTFSPSGFSHDGKTLFYLTDIRDEWGLHAIIVFVDTITGKERFYLQGHTDSVMWVGFSPNDELLATTAWDGYCKLYDGKSGDHIRDYGPTGGQNWACDFSMDSKNLAVSRGNAGANTFVWRTDDPRSFPITLKGGKGWQRIISYSSDGKRLAIGAADGRLVVYDVQSMTLKQLWQLGDVPSRWIKEVKEITWLEGGNKIAFKPSNGSTYMYDFEKNLKWKWGPKEKDQWSIGARFSTSVVLTRRGLFGSLDQDGVFRVWKIPT